MNEEVEPSPKHGDPMPEQTNGELCWGCPPVGYPTDSTRCETCPRRAVKATRCTHPGGNHSLAKDSAGKDYCTWCDWPKVAHATDL